MGCASGIGIASGHHGRCDCGGTDHTSNRATGETRDVDGHLGERGHDHCRMAGRMVPRDRDRQLPDDSSHSGFASGCPADLHTGIQP